MARPAAKRKSQNPDALASYRAKRDFTRTGEPSGTTRKASGNSFVVQKHAATRLHYDFRLELDGVLLSWAVTRGPSLDPDDKRLAVRTEDHPLDYGGFEGTIPKGEYGGGTVMLWDSGSWEMVEGKDPRKSLAGGHLHFILHGTRMQGEWILIRLKPRGKEKRENWLLRKVQDQHAGGSDDLVTRELTSIDSGRTMDEIAEGKPAPKMAARKAKTSTPPPFRPVQLAVLADHVPAGDDWLHEQKFDGYRVLIAIGGGEGRAYTRSGLDWSDRFAGLIADALKLKATSALIDGEAVVMLPDGRSSFAKLQAALKHDPGAIAFFAFDLIELDGEDLTKLPLIERKAKLAKLLGKGRSRLGYSDHIEGKGEQLFERFCSSGLEGVISKRSDSRYGGLRSGSWVKTKCTRRQEFVIIGWTASQRQRGFRSLLLGVNQGGKLHYAGKVWTGFSANEIDRLLKLMTPLARKTAPVSAPAASVRSAHWIKPQLVAEIAFTEVTADGVLRHSSYLGLRQDKQAEAVTMEAETPANSLGDAAGSGVAISNRDRVIFPECGITKGQLADYYERVAAIMLPWTGNRPVSLVRCPQGRAKKCFFQKHDAGSFGDAVRQVAIREKDGGEEAYLYIDSPAGLLSCVQMGSIEFHGWGARIEDVEKPDRMAFDLDPDEGMDFAVVIKATFHLREVLAQMGLVSFAMVTGGKGVHVIVPLTPSAEWPAVKDFAHRLATALATAEPDRFTAAMAKARRKGRIFIDYLRNQRGATAVMPYSARAREFAPVAVPLSWEELRDLDKASHWHVGDAGQLVDRAASPELSRWGLASQTLPEI